MVKEYRHFWIELHQPPQSRCFASTTLSLLSQRVSRITSVAILSTKGLYQARWPNEDILWRTFAFVCAHEPWLKIVILIVTRYLPSFLGETHPSSINSPSWISHPYPPSLSPIIFRGLSAITPLMNHYHPWIPMNHPSSTTNAWLRCQGLRS